MIKRICGLKKQLDRKSKFVCFSVWRKNVVCSNLTSMFQYPKWRKIRKAKVRKLWGIPDVLSLFIQGIWSLNMISI